MTKKFSLLRQLGEQAKNPKSAEPLLPRGKKYNLLTPIVENEPVEVYIPLRETESFETTISNLGKYISRHDFSEVLLKHRGIRNRE